MEHDSRSTGSSLGQRQHPGTEKEGRRKLDYRLRDEGVLGVMERLRGDGGGPGGSGMGVGKWRIWRGVVYEDWGLWKGCKAVGEMFGSYGCCVMWQNGGSRMRVVGGG